MDDAPLSAVRDTWDATLPADAPARRPWHDAAVTDLAFTPDGRAACSAGRDGAVRVWDLLPLELRWHFERPARQVIPSPDGRVAWIVTQGCELWPVDLTAGLEHERAWAPSWRVRATASTARGAVSPDGRWALPPCDDGAGGVALVDLHRGSQRALTAPGAGELHPFGRFTPDARALTLLGGVREGRVGRARSAAYRYAVADGAVEEIRALRFGVGVRAAVQLHRGRCALGGRWLVAADAGGAAVGRWSFERDEPVRWIDAGVSFSGVVATGDRVLVLSCARGRGVAVLDHATARCLGVVTVDAEVTALAVSPDERTVLVGTAAGTVRSLRVEP